MTRIPMGLRALFYPLHAALWLWALSAWVSGPFRGEGVLDGHEVLELARTGSAGAFETKSLLYPWLLGLATRATGEVPWTTGVLGIAISLGVLAAVERLCLQLGSERAAPWAMGLYALSGSALVFAVQPLPVLLATLLLAWGALLLQAARERDRWRSLAGGALLGASAFTRAPLAIAAFLLVGRQARARRFSHAAKAVAGAALVALACFAAFGARAWPSGSAFNLRQGNGAARSGISDLRPGPLYDRARYEAAFAPVDVRGAPPDFERFQRRRLLEEIAADVPGAALTLLRKAYLFFHRTETVTSADFRHGLRDFPPLPLLLWSFALVAPLALASLLGKRPALLWLPILGVFAVNVVWLTSARYRFPALPFLCAAAGLFLATAPRRRDWLAALALALVLVPNLSGRRLTVPGDGLVQEGRLWLSLDRRSPRAREVLEEAVAIGADPRAHYELALACESAAGGDGQHLARAEEHYRQALRIDPLYPQAGENLMALLMRQGRDAEALELGRELMRTSPHAGGAWLNAAELERNLDPSRDVGPLLAEGHRILALRFLAENELPRGRRHAEEARRLGMDDPRLAPLFEPGP